jgi:hypothetical protein
MDEVEHIAGGAPQAVRFGHRQLVSGSQGIRELGQLVPTIPACPAHPLDADQLTFGVTEPGFLQSAVLIGG